MNYLSLEFLCFRSKKFFLQKNFWSDRCPVTLLFLPWPICSATCVVSCCLLDSCSVSCSGLLSFGLTFVVPCNLLQSLANSCNLLQSLSVSPAVVRQSDFRHIDPEPVCSEYSECSEWSPGRVAILPVPSDSKSASFNSPLISHLIRRLPERCSSGGLFEFPWRFASAPDR